MKIFSESKSNANRVRWGFIIKMSYVYLNNQSILVNFIAKRNRSTFTAFEDFYKFLCKKKSKHAKKCIPKNLVRCIYKVFEQYLNLQYPKKYHPQMFHSKSQE